MSVSLSVLYSNVDCLTQSKKLELEYLLSNKKVDIVALTEIYPPPPKKKKNNKKKTAYLRIWIAFTISKIMIVSSAPQIKEEGLEVL